MKSRRHKQIGKAVYNMIVNDKYLITWDMLSHKISKDISDRIEWLKNKCTNQH